jgi:uncharacterized membrane protein
MPFWLNQLFLAFHLFGAFMWLGGLFTLTQLLDVIKAEPNADARARLAKYTRKAAMLPDIGATITILFGLHRLFKFKAYEFHYMHAKLLLVVIVIALHGLLRVKTKRAAEGKDVSVPGFVRPLLMLLTLGILALVIMKL